MGKGGRRRNVDGEREVADNLHFLGENALSRSKYSGVGKKYVNTINFSILHIKF